MWKKIIFVVFTLNSALSFASPEEMVTSSKLKDISVALLEIDQKEVGSKALQCLIHVSFCWVVTPQKANKNDAIF